MNHDMAKRLSDDMERQTAAFLADLSELSYKHGVAIAGTPVLFVMGREDYESAYSLDEESNLSFG